MKRTRSAIDCFRPFFTSSHWVQLLPPHSCTVQRNCVNV